MSETIHIRRACKKDAGEIGRIHVEATRAAYHGIYSDDYLQSLSAEERTARCIEKGKGHLAMDDPDFAVFAAFLNGQMIGFADVGPASKFQSSRQAELFAIYLDPHHVGKNAGRDLFLACTKHASKRVFHSMKAEVLSKNFLARNFYQRMQGRPLYQTEKLIQTGGVKENIITYQWPTLQQP
jgi:ribosomal protein S18 acetylase RimI-like enzyme